MSDQSQPNIGIVPSQTLTGQQGQKQERFVGSEQDFIFFSKKLSVIEQKKITHLDITIIGKKQKSLNICLFVLIGFASIIAFFPVLLLLCCSSLRKKIYPSYSLSEKVYELIAADIKQVRLMGLKSISIKVLDNHLTQSKMGIIYNQLAEETFPKDHQNQLQPFENFEFINRAMGYDDQSNIYSEFKEQSKRSFKYRANNLKIKWGFMSNEKK